MKKREVFEKKKSPEILLQLLMDRYMGFVYSIVYKNIGLVASKEDVEETVSDVFVKVYNSLDKFDPNKGSEKSFIGVIARNTAIDRYRQIVGKDILFLSLDDCLDKKDGDFSADKSYLTKVERQMILEGVLGLKEPDRTIVFRHYYLEETLSQIAKKIGHSPNAVQKRLKRSLKKLESVLGGYFDE